MSSIHEHPFRHAIAIVKICVPELLRLCKNHVSAFFGAAELQFRTSMPLMSATDVSS
jgi:hypothetical protein